MRPRSQWVVLLILCFLTVSGISYGELTIRTGPVQQTSSALEVTVPETFTGYRNVEITILSPAAGECEITVSDVDGLVRNRWTCSLKEGSNTVSWKGSAIFGQPLYEGTYTVSASIKENGKTITAQAETRMIENALQILYAVPSSSILYLQGEDVWQLDAGLSRRGNVRMDVLDSLGNVQATVSKTVSGNEIARLQWTGRSTTGSYVVPGRYTIRIYPAGLLSQALEMPLYVQNTTENPLRLCSVGITGRVIPDIQDPGDMTDTAIWNYMMQPSVIYAGDTNEEIDVRAVPVMRTPTIGYVHAQSQALEILEFLTDEEGRKWARIRAFNQRDGAPVEGYIPVDNLRVRLPDTHYGLLIDKRNQTMRVYEYGACIGEVPVSTGLSTAYTTRRETVTGAFFVSNRTNVVSDGGGRYDFGLRYDGFRLLTQTPYTRQDDNSHITGEQNLGERSTQGGIHISASGSLPVNAWWVFTHLPENTRVMVIGDTVETDGALSGESTQVSVAPDPEKTYDRVRITLGGILGTGRAEDGKTDLPDSLAALSDRFLADDMTVLTLGSVFKDDTVSEHTERPDVRRRATGDAKLLYDLGIDHLCLASRHLSDYHYEGYVSTADTMAQAGIRTVSEGYPEVIELHGHRIGFVALSLSDYLQEKTICASEIQEARQAGCEACIALVEFGMPGSSWHGKYQEEMAQRLAEAGADLIAGTGGELQTVTQIQGVPVFYGIGTLLNGDRIRSDSVLVSLELLFDADGYTGCEAEIIPLEEENGLVGPCSEEMEAYILSDMFRDMQPLEGKLYFEKVYEDASALLLTAAEEGQEAPAAAEQSTQISIMKPEKTDEAADESPEEAPAEETDEETEEASAAKRSTQISIMKPEKTDADADESPEEAPAEETDEETEEASAAKRSTQISIMKPEKTDADADESPEEAPAEETDEEPEETPAAAAERSTQISIMKPENSDGAAAEEAPEETVEDTEDAPDAGEKSTQIRILKPETPEKETEPEEQTAADVTAPAPSAAITMLPAQRDTDDEEEPETDQSTRILRVTRQSDEAK